MLARSQGVPVRQQQRMPHCHCVPSASFRFSRQRSDGCQARPPATLVHRPGCLRLGETRLPLSPPHCVSWQAQRRLSLREGSLQVRSVVAPLAGVRGTCSRRLADSERIRSIGAILQWGHDNMGKAGARRQIQSLCRIAVCPRFCSDRLSRRRPTSDCRKVWTICSSQD
jgi:hypothetical protein